MTVHVGYIFKLKEIGVPRKTQLANLEGKRPTSSIFSLKAPTLLGLVEFLHCFKFCKLSLKMVKCIDGMIKNKIT